MNASVLFKLIFFVLFAVLLAIRLFFGWRVHRAGHSSWATQKEAVEREGWLSMLLRPVMFLALLALVGLYALLPEKTTWMFIPLPDGIRLAAAGLGIAGLAFLAWVHQTLREYWSTVLQLRQSHRLITSGPYRHIRHPMYSALTLCFLSLAFVSAAWPLLILVLGIVPFFYRVTIKEEEMLIGQFGDEYREYRKRTGRFVPRLPAPVRF